MASFIPLKIKVKQQKYNLYTRWTDTIREVYFEW
jgi:hypothetical protein